MMMNFRRRNGMRVRPMHRRRLRRRRGFWKEVVCGVFVTSCKNDDDDDYGEKSTLPDDSYYMGIHTNALLSRFGDLSLRERRRRRRRQQQQQQQQRRRRRSNQGMMMLFFCVVDFDWCECFRVFVHHGHLAAPNGKKSTSDS